jgi:hypothetical protein
MQPKNPAIMLGAVNAGCPVSLILMLNVIILIANMPNVIMPKVVLLNVIMLSIIMLSIIMLSIIMLSIIILSIIMLSIIMMDVIMVYVIMMNVVCRSKRLHTTNTLAYGQHIKLQK